MRNKSLRCCSQAPTFTGHHGSDGGAPAATAVGHERIVRLLLKRGAADQLKGPSGASPLQIAALEGYISLVRLLLRKGAKIDDVSNPNGTALSAAASRGRESVVKFLLKKGASVRYPGRALRQRIAGGVLEWQRQYCIRSCSMPVLTFRSGGRWLHCTPSQPPLRVMSASC